MLVRNLRAQSEIGNPERDQKVSVQSEQCREEWAFSGNFAILILILFKYHPEKILIFLLAEAFKKTKKKL